MENKSTKQPHALTLDVEKYEHLLEDENLTEQQKRECLETLWNLVCECVMLGFEIHPLQAHDTACGELNENAIAAPLLSPDMLEYAHHTLNDIPKNNAELDTVSDEGGV